MDFLNNKESPDQEGRWPLTHYRNVLLQATLGVAIGFAIFEIKIDYLEYFFYDTLVKYSPAPTPTGKITLVEYKQEGPAPSLKNLTQFLKSLEGAKLKSLIIDFDPTILPGTNAEQAELATEAEKWPQLLVALEEVEKDFKFQKPFSKLKATSASRTYDRNILAKDGVTRRVIVKYQDTQLLVPYVSSLLEGARERYAGQFTLLGAEQLMIRYRRPKAFETYSIENALTNLDPKSLSNKVLIVGFDLHRGLEEYVSTPLVKDPPSTSLAEMHANMIETLINDDAIKHAPRWLNLLLTLLLAVLTVQAVLRLRPVLGIVAVLIAVLTFLVVSYLAFWPLGIWIHIAHPLLAIFVCYYFFIPYRLIVESRRSWEYLQKNRLLSQVEELKTNFISMMSHDLKTPLARIQGMTDMILKEAATLSPSQREAVDLIRSSSSDLLKFISSILNYAVIESRGVELVLEGKDINKLLTDVIAKHDFLAKVKRIKIQTDLEPMFSIKIDPNLMTQVFSNLVENAIKYSPEGSQILVNSKEVDGHVQVEVADNGPGIPAEDLGNVFMKFFRSKNAKTSTIKGSGLGLYLAKYFVELHRGRIKVASQTGQGTVFTVELPLNS